eukprot:354894-Chlamydomonas_euryale.AAC.2
MPPASCLLRACRAAPCCRLDHAKLAVDLPVGVNFAERLALARLQAHHNIRLERAQRHQRRRAKSLRAAATRHGHQQSGGPGAKPPDTGH